MAFQLALLVKPIRTAGPGLFATPVRAILQGQLSRGVSSGENEPRLRENIHLLFLPVDCESIRVVEIETQSTIDDQIKLQNGTSALVICSENSDPNGSSPA